MVVLEMSEIKEFDLDAFSMRVLLKALEILGGPRKLIEYRNLTWVPSLIQAAYAIVMSRELLKTENEIASFLGLTRQTVRNMLRADEEMVLKKLEGEFESKTIKAHTAGGLAKLAYREIKEGRDNLDILIGILGPTIGALEITWPTEVLKRVKGTKFPISKEDLINKLQGFKIEGINILTIIEKIEEFPIKNPADLLSKIKEALQNVEKEKQPKLDL
ncbi:MAG: bacterio-opsin activator [Thermosulfidibacteraceae bacterium]|jgi:probable regulatory domain-containing protein